MFLVVTATEQELNPIARQLANTPGWTPLVAGIGCLESAVTLTRFLSVNAHTIDAIINCGVAGAFVGAGPKPLDVCLAELEIQADIGIWTSSGITGFDTIQVPHQFALDLSMREKAYDLLVAAGITAWLGPFVSVSAVSGIECRGEALRQQHHAICENMEGAAVARVAQEFHLPCLEVRTISNMVIDRDLSQWHLAQAIQQLAQAMQILLPGLIPCL